MRNLATRSKRSTTSHYTPDQAQAPNHSSASFDTVDFDATSAHGSCETNSVQRMIESCVTSEVQGEDAFTGELRARDVDAAFSSYGSDSLGNTVRIYAGGPLGKGSSSKPKSSLFASTTRVLGRFGRKTKKEGAPASGMSRKQFTASALFDESGPMSEWRNHVQDSAWEYDQPQDAMSIVDVWETPAPPLSIDGTGSTTGSLSSSFSNMVLNHGDKIDAKPKKQPTLRPGEPGWLSAQDEQRRLARRSFDDFIATQRDTIDRHLFGDQTQEYRPSNDLGQREDLIWAKDLFSADRSEELPAGSRTTGALEESLDLRLQYNRAFCSSFYFFGIFSVGSCRMYHLHALLATNKL